MDSSLPASSLAKKGIMIGRKKNGSSSNRELVLIRKHFLRICIVPNILLGRIK